MKKTLLLLLFVTSFFNSYAQVIIYDTTHASLNGAETTGTANGAATSFGDIIKLAGTERLLNSITLDMFCLNDFSDFTITMTIYTDCPTVSGAGVCGSGTGTLIFGSEVTVAVTPPTTATLFQVVFPFNDLDISSETDNTITVMVNASRNNVFWTINETPVVGSLPDGDTALSTLVRCGSTGTNNGCNRVFTAPTNNNLAMTIRANAALLTNQFLASKFSIYPNPANDIVTISANGLNMKSIEISDINGRIVKNNIVSGSETQINISDLSQGVYMMKITSDEGVATKRIVKE